MENEDLTRLKIEKLKKENKALRLLFFASVFNSPGHILEIGHDIIRSIDGSCELQREDKGNVSIFKAKRSLRR